MQALLKIAYVISTYVKMF